MGGDRSGLQGKWIEKPPADSAFRARPRPLRARLLRLRGFRRCWLWTAPGVPPGWGRAEGGGRLCAGAAPADPGRPSPAPRPRPRPRRPGAFPRKCCERAPGTSSGRGIWKRVLGVAREARYDIGFPGPSSPV